MRFFHISLVFLLLVLQFVLWGGRGGLTEIQHLKNHEEELRRDIADATARNKRLVQEIAYLKRNDDLVEAIARHELGLIGEGETFYRITQE